jgi:hypothetical protein
MTAEYTIRVLLLAIFTVLSMSCMYLLAYHWDAEREGSILLVDIKKRINQRSTGGKRSSTPALHESFQWSSQGELPIIQHCTNRVHATTKYAIVSLLSMDEQHFYTQSAIKLARSVRWWLSSEQVDLLMMATVMPLDIDAALQRAGWKICLVPVLEHAHNTTLTTYNRFFEAKLYSKLNMWALSEYEGILYLDSDTLVIRDPSQLFTHHLPKMQMAGKTLGAVRDRPEIISKYFNAGVLLLSQDAKSLNPFGRLTRGISQVPHDESQAEQGLLNVIYGKSYYHLPYIYNANLVSKMVEPDLWRRNENSISILHFTVSKGWASFRHFNPLNPISSFDCWWWSTADLCQLWEQIH